MSFAVDGRWPTLADVIRNLDSEVLRVVHAPGAGWPRVSDVVITDPTDPHALHAGCIALGVGLSGSESEAVTLVDRAARCGAAAIVLRTEDELPGRVVETAERLDLALLTVPPEMTWGQLHSLLRTATTSAGALDEADAAGVPVGDLFALADAIAVAVAGPVTIEDARLRVLAYANLDYPIDEPRRQTILGRTPPMAWRDRLEAAGVLQALQTQDGVVRFERPDEKGFATRIAAPVRAGSELLGSIWVAETGVPFGPEAEAALLRFAQVAAIHLISHRASENVKRRTRGAFVREVLAGRVPAASAGAEVPFRTVGPFTVLAFEPAAPAHPSQGERVLSVISLYCEDADRDAMCALVAGRFWALLPTPRRGARERTVELLARIVERVERTTQVRLLAAAGTSVGKVRDVPRSRRAAEQALKVLARQPGGRRVVHVEDVRAHVVLLDLLDLAAAEPGLREGKLDALIAHDREHGSEYTETLRQYLDCRCDAGEAAGRLGVHRNTVRYRLGRLVALSGLNLEDADERLVTELQLRMLA